MNVLTLQENSHTRLLSSERGFRLNFYSGL